MIVVTDRRDDARTDEPDTVAIDAIPVPVVGYEIADEAAVLTVANDAFAATFDATSIGTSVRAWLLENGAVDEATVTKACDALANGDAIDLTIGLGPGEAASDERRPVRLRSFDGPIDGGAEGYVLTTEPPPNAVDSAEPDSVTSVVTHDLRNPLDVANAHLLAARETGEVEHFDQVRDAHDRMERIIQNALTLSRGERTLDVIEGVAVGTVASDAWATVDTGAASLTVAEDLPPTDADLDRLQRLFENLFRNAVEHGSTESRNATESVRNDAIRVQVGSVDDGFFVADDGPGIPADERERVFEPGYSSNETGRGTGLGLTIVERIARAHDWTVSITEGSHGGARFEFRPKPDDD